MSKAILEMKNIGINFGGLRAVDGFSIALKKGELVGLIGPNGAGKTTVFNIITGVYEHTDGEYILDDKKIKGIGTSELVRQGLARTFQNIRLFSDMSVIDNVMVAMNFRMKYKILSSAFRLPKFWKEESEARKKAYELLDLFDLSKNADIMAGNLSYGQQRKLEIVRALATNPKVLLLDEPAAGMNPSETQELMDMIKFIRDKFNLCVLLIEHDMNLVLGICERIIVLDHGKILAQGNPKEVVKKEAVIEAYLGIKED